MLKLPDRNSNIEKFHHWERDSEWIQSGFKVTRPTPWPEPCSDVWYQRGWRHLSFVCLYKQIDVVDNHPDLTAKRAQEVETAAGGGVIISDRKFRDPEV